MNKNLLGVLLGAALWAVGDTAVLFAQTRDQHSIRSPSAPAPTLITPAEPDAWKAPFGGTYDATLTFATDYSFRGISQTALQPAGQATFGYETPSIGQEVSVSAYVGAWGSNYVSPDSKVEVDFLTGLKAKALDGKLTFDLGFLRYFYLNAPSDLSYNFSEFGLVADYNFDVFQVKAALYYSPNMFADSGVGWYKWAQVAVPLRFIHFNENVALRLYGSIGNQYVERYLSYGIAANNYWDWQVGLAARLYGFELTLAYVDTNLDVASCGNTYNCQARAIFTFSKSF